jgi:hypothetical protein
VVVVVVVVVPLLLLQPLPLLPLTPLLRPQLRVACPPSRWPPDTWASTSSVCGISPPVPIKA